MTRRYRLGGFLAIALLAVSLHGCYIHSGMHRLTYKVTRIDPDGTECNVDLTKKRPDGWTVIACEEEPDPTYGPGYELKGAARR